MLEEAAQVAVGWRLALVLGAGLGLRLGQVVLVSIPLLFGTAFALFDGQRGDGVLGKVLCFCFAVLGCLHLPSLLLLSAW